MIYSAGAISIYSGFFEIVFTSNLPKIGRFLFGGAQQSIVDSSSMEEKLTAVQGIAVAVAWIVLLTFAAYAAEKRREKICDFSQFFFRTGSTCFQNRKI